MNDWTAVSGQRGDHWKDGRRLADAARDLRLDGTDGVGELAQLLDELAERVDFDGLRLNSDVELAMTQLRGLLEDQPNGTAP